MFITVDEGKVKSEEDNWNEYRWYTPSHLIDKGLCIFHTKSSIVNKKMYILFFDLMIY